MQANSDLMLDLAGNTVADALVALLRQAGARHVFAMPGEALNAFLEAVRKDSQLTLVNVRHEGYGSIMASSYAKLSGRPGVCLGAAGPGTTHLVLGVYDANADGAPLVCISGQVPRAVIGTGAFQEIDSRRLFAAVTGYSETADLPHAIATMRAACTHAVNRNAAAHLSVPADVFRAKAMQDRWASVDRPLLRVPIPPADEDVVNRAAEMLLGTRKAIIAVGNAQPAARAPILALAEQLGAPVVVMPEGIHVGLRRGDSLLVDVTSAPRSAGRRLCTQAGAVVAVGGMRGGLAGLVSPSAVVVELVPAADSTQAGAALRIAGQLERSLELLIDACIARQAAPARRVIRPVAPPPSVFPVPDLWRAINALWPPDGLIAIEPGALLDDATEYLVVEDRRVTSSFNGGVRGYAVPGAIGGAFAFPGRPVVAITTADDFSESMAELLTAAKYALPVTVLCLVPDLPEPPLDVLAYARSCNVKETWAATRPSLERALQRSLHGRVPQFIAAPAAFARPRGRMRPASHAQTRIGPDTLAGQLADTFATVGVKRLYGKKRAPTDLLMAAADQRADMRFIRVQHPESAAMMASAVAKTLDEVTVCIAADDADSILQLNGLYDASFDGAPVLFLAPRARRDRRNMLHRLDIEALLGGLSCWQGELHADGGFAAAIATAVREAVRCRGVAVLHIDWHALTSSVRRPLDWLQGHPFVAEQLLPSKAALENAAAKLLTSPRVLIVAGRGARGASAELAALSELLAAPIATTMPGRGSVLDSFPRFIGSVGSSGHPAAADALSEADVVLALGYSARGTLFDALRATDIIRVDSNRAALASDVSHHMPLLGHVKPTVAALLGCLRSTRIRRALPARAQRMREEFLARHRRAFVRWLDQARTPRLSNDRAIAPSAACHTIGFVLDETRERATITVDVGVTTLWVYRHLFGDHERVWTASFGTMGFAVPAAIALAERLRHGAVIAIAGDGGICITLAELATAARLGVDVVAIVFDNGKLAAVKFEQEVMGWPEFGSELHNPDFAQYARACGAMGWRVTTVPMLQSRLREALQQSKPSLLDVVCDPHELPFPAQVRPLQAMGYVVALAREARSRFQRRNGS
jgi:thiamine pyrophosphate-dependent acetolactate synthase large subunit-like protein